MKCLIMDLVQPSEHTVRGVGETGLNVEEEVEPFVPGDLGHRPVPQVAQRGEFEGNTGDAAPHVSSADREPQRPGFLTRR